MVAVPTLVGRRLTEAIEAPPHATALQTTEFAGTDGFHPIGEGDPWRYFKGTHAPPVDWHTRTFDDSSWLTGTVGIGYGDGDDTTVLDDMQDQYLSVYARRGFDVLNPDRVSAFVLGLDYDDGFVAYLNGHEVWRQNVSGSPPSFDTPADSAREAGDLVYVDLDPALLIPGTNVLAIQAHNASLSSDDFTLLPVLYRGTPYLQNVTPTAITVMWETHPPAVGRVRYRRLGTTAWTEVARSQVEQIHEIRLTGLITGTSYEYQVDASGAGAWRPADPPTFRTAPPDQSGASADPHRIVVYGDSRSVPEVHRQVAEAIAGSDPDLILHVGDLVYHGRVYDEWGPQFFSPAADMLAETPVIVAWGNHEYYGDGPLWPADLLSPPEGGTETWYAFTYGCSRFIGLDSYEEVEGVSLEPGSDQYTWLSEELKSDAFDSATWQFAFFHHPPYTSGTHLSTETTAEENLVPLFEAYGVDMVFNGHNHNYERSLKSGIHYVITGGGGAPLRGFPNVDKDPYSQVRIKTYEFVTLDFDCATGRVVYNAWDVEGRVIDGPIVLVDARHRIYLPVVVGE
jgi:predicted phosphodiesterase